MEKNIKVEELVENYLKKANKESGLTYVKNTVKSEDYISYYVKIALANKIVEQTSYVKNTNTDIKQHEIKINTPLRYVLFTMGIINQYTNIIIDNANMGTEFDLLNRHGLIDIILKKIIPEKEVAEFNTILDMVASDFIQNEYETHAFVSKQITRITDVMNVLVKSTEPILSKLGEKIDNMDEKEIEKLSNKIVKFVNK